MKDLSRHIHEAIALNEKRKPLYANLTNNKSLVFSERLIRYEKLIAKTAWLVDQAGDRYQKRGVPFLIHEFVDMSEVSAFAKNFPANIQVSDPIKSLDKKLLFSEIHTGIHIQSPESIIEACNKALLVLSDQAHYYNMVRHIIESIRRIAFLVPLHESLCLSKEIKPPNFYSYLLLRSHKFLLGPAKTFDEDAAFIQEEGIPFLWQDLPSIGIDNINYNSL